LWSAPSLARGRLDANRRSLIGFCDFLSQIRFVPRPAARDGGHSKKAASFWPRTGGKPPAKGLCCFFSRKTDTGPSGLRIIGNAGESCAHHGRPGVPGPPERRGPGAGCFCFSDDMDGWRKCPTKVTSNKGRCGRPHLGKPLTAGTDPVRKRGIEIGAAKNARLRRLPRVLAARVRRFQFGDRFGNKVGRSTKIFLAMLHALRRGARPVDAADPWARSASRPIRYSCDLAPKTGPRAAGAGSQRIDAKPGTIVLSRRGDGTLVETAGHRTAVNCSGSRTGPGRWFALRRRIENVTGKISSGRRIGRREDRPHSGRQAAGWFQLTRSSRRRGKERYPSPRANGTSRSRSWLRYAAHPNRLALYIAGSSRRARQGGSISTSSGEPSNDYRGGGSSSCGPRTAGQGRGEPRLAHHTRAPANSGGRRQISACCSTSQRGPHTENEDVLWGQYLRADYVTGERSRRTAPYARIGLLSGRGGLLPGFREGLEGKSSGLPTGQGGGAYALNRFSPTPGRKLPEDEARSFIQKRGGGGGGGGGVVLRGLAKRHFRPGRAAPVFKDAL